MDALGGVARVEDTDAKHQQKHEYQDFAFIPNAVGGRFRVCATQDRHDLQGRRICNSNGRSRT